MERDQGGKVMSKRMKDESKARSALTTGNQPEVNSI
jgi:hypothetical protein